MGSTKPSGRAFFNMARHSRSSRTTVFSLHVSKRTSRYCAIVSTVTALSGSAFNAARCASRKTRMRSVTPLSLPCCSRSSTRWRKPSSTVATTSCSGEIGGASFVGSPRRVHSSLRACASWYVLQRWERRYVRVPSCTRNRVSPLLGRTMRRMPGSIHPFCLRVCRVMRPPPFHESLCTRVLTVHLVCTPRQPWQREASTSAGFVWWPQRDSNPCFSLERAVSWASRRWGRANNARTTHQHRASGWLGEEDSNPRYVVQSHVSYH